MGSNEYRKIDGTTSASGKLTDEQAKELDSFLDDLVGDGSRIKNEPQQSDGSTTQGDAHKS